jgi:hypothetical protein
MLSARSLDMTEKKVLVTHTGEYLQPVRLHYRVYDHKGLLHAFRSLRCVAQDPTQKRWVWLYDHEASDLKFQVPRSQLPLQQGPVIIGSLWPRGKDRLDLDLRSCERAALAVPFFDRHIPRKVARVTSAEIVTHLFTSEDMSLTPEAIFDRAASTPPPDAETITKELLELTANVRDPEERARIGMEYVELLTKTHSAEVEQVPLHFYEDGLSGFELALKTRQIVALRRFQGNTAYTIHDAIKDLLDSR